MLPRQAKQADSAVQQEGCILLAIKAIQSGQIKSIQAAAKAYNVKWSTLTYCICGCSACVVWQRGTPRQ